MLNAYNMLKEIDEFDNKYLDIFPSNAFTLKIEYIKNFYEGRNRKIARNFKYLSEDEMDSFVNKATILIYEDIIRLKSEIV